MIAERNGVVLRSELYGLGIGPRDLYRQVRAGEWVASGRAVLVHHTAQQGLLTQSLVAARRNPDAVLTGASACLLRPHPAWSGRNFRSGRAVIIAPPWRRGPWVTVRHPGAEHGAVGGIAVADHHTALVDALRVLAWPDAAAIAGAANRHGVTSQERLAASAALLKGSPGASQLRTLARAMAKGAESGPEIDLQLALQRANIRSWVGNPTVVIDGRRYRPDIAFLAERVAIEYDGVEEHSATASFHSDRKRDVKFQLVRGWLVLRLTSATLYDPRELDGFLADLRAGLRRRRAAAPRAGDRAPRR